MNTTILSMIEGHQRPLPGNYLNRSVQEALVHAHDAVLVGHGPNAGGSGASLGVKSWAIRDVARNCNHGGKTTDRKTGFPMNSGWSSANGSRATATYVRGSSVLQPLSENDYVHQPRDFRNARGLDKQAKRHQKFDSTLGFPGEGPQSDCKVGPGGDRKFGPGHAHDERPRNATEVAVMKERQRRRRAARKLCKSCGDEGHGASQCPLRAMGEMSAKMMADALDVRNVPAIDPAAGVAPPELTEAEKKAIAKTESDLKVYQGGKVEARFRAKQTSLGKSLESQADRLVIQRRSMQVISKLVNNPNFVEDDFERSMYEIDEASRASMQIQTRIEESRVIVDLTCQQFTLRSETHPMQLLDDVRRKYDGLSGPYLTFLRSCPSATVARLAPAPRPSIDTVLLEEFLKFAVCVTIGWLVAPLAGLFSAAVVCAFYALIEATASAHGTWPLREDFHDTFVAGKIFLRTARRAKLVRNALVHLCILALYLPYMLYATFHDSTPESKAIVFNGRMVMGIMRYVSSSLPMGCTPGFVQREDELTHGEFAGESWFPTQQPYSSILRQPFVRGKFYTQVVECTYRDHTAWLAFVALFWSTAIHLLYNHVMYTRKRPDCYLNTGARLYHMAWLKSRLVGKVTTAIDSLWYNTPIVPTQDDFVVSWGETKEREVFGVRSFVTVAGVTPTVFSADSMHNVQVGVTGRIGKKLPAHSDKTVTAAIHARWLGLKRTVLPIICGLVRNTMRPMDRQKWLQRYPPRRREQLQAAHEDPDWMNLLHPVAASFIKNEKSNQSTEEIENLGGIFKAPRIIQGCPLETTNECGPILLPAAKRFRDGMQPLNFDVADVAAGRHIVYTCGRTADEIGEYAKRAELGITGMLRPGERLVWLEDDQSRFDLHLLSGPFAFLDAYYSRKLPRRVARLLRRKLSSGRMANGTRYKVPYTMQSGWPDTSFGDTLVNTAMKMAIHGVGKRWFSIVCGDDSLTVMPDSDLEAIGQIDGLIKLYAEFGMEVEGKVSFHYDQVEFCSARLMEVENTYMLVPKLGKTIARIFSDNVDRSSKNRLAWVRGIVDTLVAFSRFSSLLGELAAAISADVGSGPKLIVYEPYKINFHRGVRRVSKNDQLLHLDQHYMMSEAEFDAACRYLRSVQVGDEITEGTVVRMAEHDL